LDAGAAATLDGGWRRRQEGGWRSLVLVGLLGHVDGEEPTEGWLRRSSACRLLRLFIGVFTSRLLWARFGLVGPRTAQSAHVREV
jgi:hypothetical protein